MLAAATATAVALASVVLVWTRGALWVPQDDDWSYLNIAFEWAEGSYFVLNGWVHMMFVTHGMLGAFVTSLVGPSVWPLELTTLLIGAIGLFSLYWIARSLLSSALSLLVIVTAGFSPLFLHLSVSFMTDIPAWALSALSIALGVSAILKQRSAMLVVGTGVALLGFGVREYAIAPYMALLVWVTWSKYPKRFRLWALVIGIVTLGISLLAYLWRRSLPGSVETVASAPLESLALFSRLLLSLALLLAPYAALGAVLFWSRRGSLWESLRTCWLGVSLGVIVAVGIAFSSSLQLAGNVIHTHGSSWTSVGDGVRSLPLWGFRALTLVGVLSLVLLLGLVGMIAQRQLIARSWRVQERRQVLSGVASLYVFICLVVMAVYFVAIFVAGAPAFDRYLLLVVPLAGIVILWLSTRSLKERISKWQKGAVVGILAVTGAFGIVITDGLNQVDGLRWQVASDLVASGIPAYKIDGGDSWFRYHQKDAPDVAQIGSLENSIPGRTWWQTFFEGSTFCRMIAIESETDLQAMYGPALSIQEERTIFGTPFRVMVFPGPDPC